MDKVKMTQKDFDELYEVEQDLTQPKIEDNIDKEPEEKTVLTETEQEIDDVYLKSYKIPEDADIQ